MVFEELHPLKSSGAADEFVGELGLIFVATATVDLLVGILGLSWEVCRRQQIVSRGSVRKRTVS